MAASSHAPGAPDGHVRFGSYRFEVGTGRLWSGAREIRLTPKAAAVLGELVSRAGTLVSKDHLFASLWSGTAVSDDALTSCIQEVRRALGDDVRRPRFIETRHRRGYQFVAPISAAAEEGGERGGVPLSDAAVAVLPFADLSRGRDQAYFCDGLGEELINVLGDVDGLRVAARTASFRFRGGSADVHEVGRQLGVGTLLEGSVRKTGDRLRVTVQLVDAASGFQRASHRVDEACEDVLAAQDKIAERVAMFVRQEVLGQSQTQARPRPAASVVPGRFAAA